MDENVENTSELFLLQELTGNIGKTSDFDEVSNISELIEKIKDKNCRESALAELSKKREIFPDLAKYMWYSPGIIPCLLQEITNTYSFLAPPQLNIKSSNRTCNVLALFQCIAAHQETRSAFLSAQIPIFFYPFLNTVNKNKPFEYLRLTALGVIGALVKVDNPEVINFLLSTEIIPLCLRIMERGSELSKTVATFIVQRILLDENGLNYVCTTAERFYAISSVLYNMINSNPSARLVKHLIRSYARISENPKIRSILKENLPAILKDKKFHETLDDSSKRWLNNLLKTLSNHTSQGNNTLSVPSVASALSLSKNQFMPDGINKERTTQGIIQGLNGPVNQNLMIPSNNLQYNNLYKDLTGYSDITGFSSNYSNFSNPNQQFLNHDQNNEYLDYYNVPNSNFSNVSYSQNNLFNNNINNISNTSNMSNLNNINSMNSSNNTNLYKRQIDDQIYGYKSGK